MGLRPGLHPLAYLAPARAQPEPATIRDFNFNLWKTTQPLGEIWQVLSLFPCRLEKTGVEEKSN
jgi:hypothetical protein